MLAPNKTKLTENSKTLILLEKGSNGPETFLNSIRIPEILVFAEDYDDPKFPQNPFVFKSSVPLKIFSKKDRTMVIPLLNLSPAYLLWFCLVKDCSILKKKFDLLKRYCSPDKIILKTEKCGSLELSNEFIKPIQSDFSEPHGGSLEKEFQQLVFHNGTLYIIH